MWALYKKRFLLNQVFILAAMIALWAINHFDTSAPVLQKLALFLGILEFAALGGAVWGARIKRQMDEQDGKLPLNKD